jgi:hypothetical protein
MLSHKEDRHGWEEGIQDTIYIETRKDLEFQMLLLSE